MSTEKKPLLNGTGSQLIHTAETSTHLHFTIVTFSPITYPLSKVTGKSCKQSLSKDYAPYMAT